ncbi:hypothetical protein HHI36_011721 [Cryptolaemus montrouzieri]
MRQVMMNFENLRNAPRVIGLTATLLNGNCKLNKVMEEVKSLEITFQAKVATVDGLEVVVGYSTNPKEFMKHYDVHVPSPSEIECLEKIDEMQLNISRIKIEGKQVNDRIKNSNMKQLEPNEGLLTLINMIKDLKFHMERFGVYGGVITCKAFSILIERMKKHCDNMVLGLILQYIHTTLGFIISQLEKTMESCNSEKESFWKFSPDKVVKLIHILDNFKRTSKESLCGLIFVERRFTAKIVYHILEALSKCDPDYSYIRSDFIIGNSNNPLNDTREGMYISKKNKEVLDRFVNKEINLLCTSQVLEEGIDIPKCTLVCKFDLPKDYRSYIQSKGRARHKTSHYYMLVESNNQNKFLEKYHQYQVVEQKLNDFLIGKTDEREAPTKEEIEDMYNESILPSYFVNGPGSAYINAVSAIPLLCRYCQSLPSDQYTTYSPEWYISVKDNMNVVTVLLPLICPLVDPIEGIPMKTKKWAKRAAAYVACIKLHQCGELNDSLLPIERNLIEEDVSYLFQHHPEEKEVGAGLKMIRNHDLQISTTSLGKIESVRGIYLHIIHLEPLFAKIENDINSGGLYDIYTSNLCFGLLTPNPLPSTCSFPIYISNGTIMVSVTNNVRLVTLTDEEIEKIREFHFVVFNDVLEVVNSFLIMDNSENAESIVIVPVKKEELVIDFEVVEQHRSIKNRQITLTHSEKIALEVNEETYLHKIVIPSYRREICSYLVTQVCVDMTPMSNFPNESYQDFCDYYQEKHQEHIVNRNQPLLLVKGLSRKMNLYKPQGLEKKRKKEKIYEELQEYLIPEMVIKEEFPAALWIQARFLPTILSRLSYLLRIETLWRKIGEDCGFPLKVNDMRPLELNLNLIKYDPVANEQQVMNQVRKNYERSENILSITSSLKSSACNKDFRSKVLESKYPWKDLDEPKDINKTLEVTVMDIEAYESFINHKVLGTERKNVHKSPVKNKYPALTYDKEFVEKSIQMLGGKHSGVVELADMYEAMTTCRANDIVNLERLETLGDSFLKYITSFYITLRFPYYDEGRATQLKGRIISNKNLFYLGRKHNVGGIMKKKDLTLKSEWVPPGFSIAQVLKNEIINNNVSVNCLFRCNFTREERISGVINEAMLEPIMTKYAANAEEDNQAKNMENMDQFLKKQCIKDKFVADVVEAILGTYLKNTGIEGCLKVIQWIGIIPPSENLQDFFRQAPPPVMKPNSTLQDILYLLPQCREMESIIGYEFKNKAYLLQAFSHASYSANRITHTYEKLEFLGDAILDLLITCFIYESCDNMTPGDLTDLRSALVNNNTFASYVVRLGLHKFLLMMNSKLQSHVDRFVEFMTMKNFDIDDEVIILLEEDEFNMAEYVDVPKVLGDIFEALAGAIFLDSGYSLETVWKVFYKIMWREIDLFSRNVPKNMVRRLYECEGAYPEFSKATTTANDKVMVKLHFHAEGRPKYVHGFGTNKIAAKKAAAKIALRYL